jgi:transposase-like protein
MARRYLKGEISLSEAAKEAQMDRMSVEEWIRRYRSEGVSGLIPSENNRIYSTEIKLAAVKDYLSGEGSQREICETYKIRSSRQLRDWIKVYNRHGDFNSVKHPGGGSYMRKGRSTAQEERIQIVKDCIESGKNYGEMALKYNVSYQQVRTWTLRYEKLGDAGLEDRRGQRKKDQLPRTELEQAQIEIEQLKHKLYLSEMENALLKKLEEIERREAFRK